MTAPDADTPGWGPALQSARTSAGESLDDVCARTRIRPAVLRDLEAGEVASSGGAVYARGHVRSVAQALGLDPALVLAVFDAESGRPVPVVVEPARLPSPRAGALRVPTAERPERSGPRWGAAGAAALSVLVLLLAVGTVTDRDRDRDAAPAGDVFAGPSAAPPDPSASAVAPPLQAAVPPPSGARLRVRVLSGSSWIRVQGAAGTQFEGVFRAGQAPKDFTDAKELRLLVGNAAALSVVCGGKDLAPAGTAGAVRRFTCSTSGLVAA